MRAQNGCLKHMKAPNGKEGSPPKPAGPFKSREQDGFQVSDGMGESVLIFKSNGYPFMRYASHHSFPAGSAR
ncbi:hypothetical protein C7N83_07395 [Neisseria iguanae]|uniref:Uncharacterized protein n=1 Tax=Neisseria iguanae TaxID=90242 RepID=A0A2P7TZR4_9NEIS|nr:hypothetical protein C7N83_07395 [Neisseria iguanae]